MAWDINSVTIVGRLTRDPEYAVTKNNTPLCKFSIANNRGNRDAESTSFFDITAWNKTADICNQYLKKGSQVIINGQLRQNRYQNQNGENRSRVVINASDVQFIGGRDGSHQDAGNWDSGLSKPSSGSGTPSSGQGGAPGQPAGPSGGNFDQMPGGIFGNDDFGGSNEPF